MFPAGPPESSRKKKPSKKTKYSDFPAAWREMAGVFVNPADDRSFPEPVTSINPQEFNYKAKGDSDETLPWGIIDPLRNTIEGSLRDFMGSHKDLNLYIMHHYATPIEQFVDVLVKRKEKKIVQSPVVDILDRWITVKVTMPGIDSDILYRIVELPASVSLTVLHDKILSSVMGWCRAYHGYVFMDMKDGTVLGPKKHSGYIDMMHVNTHCFAIGDDRKFPLAALINKVGDKCQYVYDLGDQFTHMIELVEVKEKGYTPLKNVTILDGKGACPPEDSNGLKEKSNDSYAELLAQYRRNPQSCAEAIRTIETTALNYSRCKDVNADAGAGGEDAGTGTGGAVPEGFAKLGIKIHGDTCATNRACLDKFIQPWNSLKGDGIDALKFNPLEYDISLHQRILDVMVEGPNCTLPGMYGEAAAENYNACNNCGESLKPLLVCSSCKKVRYCKRDCQREDWSDHKAYCKATDG